MKIPPKLNLTGSGRKGWHGGILTGQLKNAVRMRQKLIYFVSHAGMKNSERSTHVFSCYFDLYGYNHPMAASKPLFVIGIAGASGSGKTTLTEIILEQMGSEHIALLPHDAYYRNQDHKPLEERLKVNYDHPSSLETELMIEHIHQLKAGRTVQVPVYDFVNHTRAKETNTLEPKRLIMVEGILTFVEPKLRQLFDMKLYVDTDQDICFIRRLRRDLVERGRTMDSVVNQYLEMVRPSFLEFVEPTKRYADVIIPEGGLNQVASEMVIARLKSLIHG